MLMIEKKLEKAINGLKYIEGLHIRGKEDAHLEVLRRKAREVLKDIGTTE